MKKFAQILYGKAHWIFEAEVKPEFSPDIVLVEITDLATQPQEGWDYIDGQFMESNVSTEELLATLRAERNRLLTESDKYMLVDYPISEEQREAWKTYRQALRDMPETCGMDNPVWPAAPH